MVSDPLDLLTGAVEEAPLVQETPDNGTAPAIVEPQQAITGQSSNPLGLVLDTDIPSEKKSIIVVYGETKVGKTTEIAKILSSALWICAEPAILAPYQDWYELNTAEARAAGMRDPRLPWEAGGMARKTLPEYQPDGVTPFPTYDTLTLILKRYVAAVNAGTCPYSGIVLDEYNVLANRVWNDMLRICVNMGDPRFKARVSKKPDKYAPPREIINWVNWVCSIGRAGGGLKKFAAVCHPVEPKPEDGLKGGPAGPTAKSRYALLKSADAIIRFYKEKVRTSEDEVDDLGLGGDDGAAKKKIEQAALPQFAGEEIDDEGYTRRLQTEASDLWEAGIRSFKVPGRAKLDLRGLLLDAGFKFA